MTKSRASSVASLNEEIAAIDAAVGKGRQHLGPEAPSPELLERLQPGAVRTLDDVADIEGLIMLDLLNGNISFAKSKELREWALLLQTTTMSRQPKGKVTAFSLHALVQEAGNATLSPANGQPRRIEMDALDSLFDTPAPKAEKATKLVIEHRDTKPK